MEIDDQRQCLVDVPQSSFVGQEKLFTVLPVFSCVQEEFDIFGLSNFATVLALASNEIQ
jgi:hypothetical protein